MSAGVIWHRILRRNVVSFLTEPAVVDRIIDHLLLTFAAEKPPPEAVFQGLCWKADSQAGFFGDPPFEYFR